MTRRAAVSVLVALGLMLVILVLGLPLRPAPDARSQPTATPDPYGHWTPQQRAVMAPTATAAPTAAPTTTPSPPWKPPAAPTEVLVTTVEEYDTPELFDRLRTLSERMSLSPSSLSFGDQPVNTTSAAQTVTLTNTGSGALTIRAIAAGGDFAQTHTCPLSPSTLAAGASCTISVTFTPTATASRSGSLTVTENTTGNSRTVPLGGTDQPSPRSLRHIFALTIGSAL